MATTAWPTTTAQSSTVQTAGTYSGINCRSWINYSVGTCTTSQFVISVSMGGAFNSTNYISLGSTNYSLSFSVAPASGSQTSTGTFTYKNTNSSNNTTASNTITAKSATTFKFNRTTSNQSVTITAYIQIPSGNTTLAKTQCTYTFTVPRLDYIRTYFNANGGSISGAPYAQGNNFYKLSNNWVWYSTVSNGTYASYYQTFYYGSSGASTVTNFMNVGTFGITKVGYHVETATGWRRDSASGTALHMDTATWSQLGGSTGSNSVTTSTTRSLYANWISNSWTVTFSGNGNTGGSMANEVHYYSVASKFASNAFTKTGYHFLYWTRSDSTATYEDGYNMPGGWTTTNGNTWNFSANWEPNTYYVSYDANGGSGAPGNTTCTYDANVTLSSTVPTRPGYQFLGWSASSTATYSSWNAGQTVTTPNWITTNGGTKTLYAVWRAYEMQLLYNLNGGGLSTSPFEFIDSSNTAHYFVDYNGVIGESDSPDGTYAPLIQIITPEDSHFNLWDISSLGIGKFGYHTEASRAYNTKSDGTGVDLHQNDTSSNTTNVVTTYRINGDSEITSSVANKQLYVNWLINHYIVTTAVNDSSMGSTTGDNTYTHGNTIVLTATPNSGYRFVEWTITRTDVSPNVVVKTSSANPINIQTGFINSPMTEDGSTYVALATFAKVPWYIKVNGTWVDGTPYVKVSGTWKTVNATYVKVNGTWIQI